MLKESVFEWHQNHQEPRRARSIAHDYDSTAKNKQNSMSKMMRIEVQCRRVFPRQDEERLDTSWPDHTFFKNVMFNRNVFEVFSKY